MMFNFLTTEQLNAVDLYRQAKKAATGKLPTRATAIGAMILMANEEHVDVEVKTFADLIHETALHSRRITALEEAAEKGEAAASPSTCP